MTTNALKRSAEEHFQNHFSINAVTNTTFSSCCQKFFLLTHPTNLVLFPLPLRGAKILLLGFTTFLKIMLIKSCLRNGLHQAI